MINNINNSINTFMSNMFYSLSNIHFMRRFDCFSLEDSQIHTLNFKIFNICTLQEKYLMEQFSIFNIINTIGLNGSYEFATSDFNNENEMKRALIFWSRFFRHEYKMYYIIHDRSGTMQRLFNNLMQW